MTVKMIDYVEKQAAIETVSKLVPTLMSPDGTHPADEEILRMQEFCVDVMEAIEIMPAALQWIPADKKPKAGTDVLLQFEKNMAVGFYSCGSWNINSGNGFYTGLTSSEDQPIAWMKLPQKYVEDMDE